MSLNLSFLLLCCSSLSSDSEVFAAFWCGCVQASVQRGLLHVAVSDLRAVYIWGQCFVFHVAHLFVVEIESLVRRRLAGTRGFGLWHMGCRIDPV